MADNENINDFITRWSASGGSERANYQLFLAELADLLNVPRPDPAGDDNRDNAYVFERSIRFTDGDGRQTTNYIDLYKRGCFVCETKQGVDAPGGDDLLTAADLAPPPEPKKSGHGKRGSGGWDRAMKKARAQGERYIRALPAGEGRPHSCSSSTSVTNSKSTPNFRAAAAPTRPFRTRVRTASSSTTCATKQSAPACTPSGPTRSVSTRPAAAPPSPEKLPPTSPNWPNRWKRANTARNRSPASSPAACSPCSPKTSACCPTAATPNC